MFKFVNNNIRKTDCNSLPCTSIATVQWQIVVEKFVVENLKGIKRHTLSKENTQKLMGKSIRLKVKGEKIHTIKVNMYIVTQKITAGVKHNNSATSDIGIF